VEGERVDIWAEHAPQVFYADYRPNYRKEAADDGWKRMQAWFRKYGVA